jgi:hypothetical protein
MLREQDVISSARRPEREAMLRSRTSTPFSDAKQARERNGCYWQCILIVLSPLIWLKSFVLGDSIYYSEVLAGVADYKEIDCFVDCHGYFEFNSGSM